MTYYPNGAIAGFVYGNGIVHTLTQNIRGLPDRSRDADGSVSIHDDGYDYDKAGNVVAISDGVAGARGDRDLAYDDLNRLVTASSPMFGTASYGYDAVDNLARVQVTGGNQPRTQDYCYDTSNRLTNLKTGGCSAGATVVGLGYDVQGNLANRNGTAYTFDYGNRLRRTGAERYSYDALGRRYYALNGSGTVNSLYSQAGQLLYQYDGRAMKRRHYVYLGGSLVAEHSQPLSGGGAATVTYQHTDALGSPVATTDAARAVLQRSEYEPFGALVNRPMQDGPGYTGHVTDAGTGLVYMQQRYYDPVIAAFLSVDPVTANSPGGAFNRYWYANADPFGLTDPDGRQAATQPNTGKQCDLECKRRRQEERDRKRNSAFPGSSSRSPEMFVVADPVQYVSDHYGIDPAKVLFTADEYDDCGQTFCWVGLTRAGEAELVKPLTGTPPLVGRGGLSKLFGKGGLLNSGRYLRIGIGRDGGQSVFRVAGEGLSKVPKPIRQFLKFKEIAPGVFKWDLWSRGGL